MTVLTHFSPVSHFYTPWKRQKTFGQKTFGLKWVKDMKISYVQNLIFWQLLKC